MKKHVFQITVVTLIVVLAIVSFYMLYVHIPYYQYHHGLDEIRNEICEKNQYEYKGYFDQYNGADKYYIARVNIDGVLSYVAFNEKQELIDTYQGPIADENDIKKAIESKYEIQFNQLDVGYENNKFVYWSKYQDESSLMYIYYDLASGEFVKAVQLG